MITEVSATRGCLSELMDAPNLYQLLLGLKPYLTTNFGFDEETVREIYEGLEVSREKIEQADISTDYMRIKKHLARVGEGSLQFLDGLVDRLTILTTTVDPVTFVEIANEIFKRCGVYAQIAAQIQSIPAVTDLAEHGYMQQLLQLPGELNRLEYYQLVLRD